MVLDGKTAHLARAISELMRLRQAALIWAFFHDAGLCPLRRQLLGSSFGGRLFGSRRNPGTLRIGRATNVQL